MLIRDALGNVAAELSHYLGPRTNNVAEYSALIAALEWAVAQGARELSVISDSELLVKQMLGIYKVKSPDLKELYDRAQVLRRKLAKFEIKHVLRAQNRGADRLANLAMDKGMGRSAASVSEEEVATSSVRPPAAKSLPGSSVSASATTAWAKAGTLRRGIVKHGVVEFLGADLPEGTLVEVRPVKL